MSKYDKVKHYYDKGYWSINMVRNAVVKGWITPEQYETITGAEYEEESGNEE